MFVWYRGCNKAWCGYTGGVVYSRTPDLAPEALPAVKEVRGKGLLVDFVGCGGGCDRDRA